MEKEERSSIVQDRDEHSEALGEWEEEMPLMAGAMLQWVGAGGTIQRSASFTHFEKGRYPRQRSEVAPEVVGGDPGRVGRHS